jgi:hypothetical protein
MTNTSAAPGPFTLEHLLAVEHGHLLPIGVDASVAIGAQTLTAVLLGALKDSAGGVRVGSLASGNAAGVLCTVTFGTPYLVAPKAVLLTARTAATAALGLWVSAISTTAFTVSAGSAPAASTTYDLNYAVIG